MNLISYLKDRVLFIIGFLLSMLLVLLVLFSFKVNEIVIILIGSIMCFFNMSFIIYDYLKRSKFYKYFSNILSQLDKKYLIHEVNDKGDFLEASLLLDYISDINKSYNDDLSYLKNNMEDFKNYLSIWTHEIKTPIATSRLIISNNSNSITNSIDEELKKIEDYVEQVMYYSRSEIVEKDYFISEISLKSVINDVIKSNKKDILNKKIKVNNLNEDISILSDSKWLTYIINQIVSNAIKYSADKPEISFNYKINSNSIILNIKDNGIGINDNEIKKVFDKGFTGSNGRKYSKSTGMGLFLCKKLCDKLSHDLLIESKIKSYTIVTIVFPIDRKKQDLTNM